jgi:hypothetical protein
MRQDHYLPPRLLQLVGLALLVGFAVFWALTGRESVLLVGAAGSLILLGGYERVRQALTEIPEPPSPPPVAPAHSDTERPC